MACPPSSDFSGDGGDERKTLKRRGCRQETQRYSAAISSSVGHFFISTRCSYFSRFDLS
jgi:hypothetical protein